MINSVALVGRLGKEPELRHTQNGNAVCKFTLATSEKYQDKEETQWHTIITWNKQAENCAQYLAKGSLVHVQGKIQYRKYQAQDETDRYVTEIVAFRVTFLSRSEKRDEHTRQGEPPPIDEEEIPF